jgi:hypothetical protein
MWFAVFEYDAWPESIKDVAVTSPAGKTFYVQYPSAQSALDYNTINIYQGDNKYAGSYSANNNRIEYNMVQK